MKSVGKTASAGNDPAMVASFTGLFREHGSRALIADCNTSVDSITIAGITFPLTVNDRQTAPTNYMCCPSAAYVGYALDETRNFAANPLLRKAVRAAIRSAAPLVRASRLDHQVQLNNWLFSTNPVPGLNAAAAIEIRDALTALHPDRAILIRSLNTVADAATITALESAGFVLLPARQIYIATGTRLSSDMKRDRKLMEKTPYGFVGNDAITANDHPRCEALYRMLYIDKYSPFNPHYTPLYIGEMHKRGLLHLAGYRNANGELAAFTGFFENGTTLTQPLVGYDTSLPQSDGLYRLVMALGQKRATDRGLFFNMSAGAAKFKRLRGAIPATEYNAVHVAQLGAGCRAAVRAMQALLTRIGIPLLQRFEL